MNEKQSLQMIEFRLKQARETIEEAATLYHESLWRGAINRSYYAMFYSVLALAVQKRSRISKHTGVIAFFDREFVKNDVFPKELSKSLHLAFDRRQTSDYGEVFSVGEVLGAALGENSTASCPGLVLISS